MTKQVEKKKAPAEVIPLYPKESIHRLPAQYDLFTGEPKVLPLVIDWDFDEDLHVSEDIVLARSGDAAQLILSGFGLFLSKKSDRLIVKKGKDLLYEFPVVFTGKASKASYAGSRNFSGGFIAVRLTRSIPC